MNKGIQVVSILLVVLSIGVLYFLHFNQQESIAYVDSAKLINGYQGMIDAREIYKEKAQGWQANIDTLSKEVERSIKDYEKESPSMSAKEKDLSKELIRTKQKQLMDYQRAMNEKASQEDSQMTSKIIEEVNAYLKKYGEEHDYKIIMAATEYGNVAYADESLDLTEEVLNGLNKSYSGQ